MKRHLHFVQSIEPLQGGGLGRAALELHDSFRESGADSRLVATYSENPQAPDHDGVEEFKRKGISKFYYSPSLRRSAGGLAATADVLHAHGFYVGTNWMLGGAARRLNRSLVCHVHGFFEPWILDRSRSRKALVRLLFENANFRAARLWRALTNKEADQIRGQGITAPIVVAANGVHLRTYDEPGPEEKRSRWSQKSRPRMLFLGRLHPKKGIDLLIPAWVESDAAKQGWELIIAGPDENGHRAVIQRLIDENALGDSVSLPGTVTGADKVALLRSADGFVLPSYSEGFSVAILEAMACRVPVIATRTCNFPELASKGGGWLCDPELQSVTDALNDALAASESERADRGLAARRLVEERYTWRTIAQTITDACEQHC